MGLRVLLDLRWWSAALVAVLLLAISLELAARRATASRPPRQASPEQLVLDIGFDRSGSPVAVSKGCWIARFSSQFCGYCRTDLPRFLELERKLGELGCTSVVVPPFVDNKPPEEEAPGHRQVVPYVGAQFARNAAFDLTPSVAVIYEGHVVWRARGLLSEGAWQAARDAVVAAAASATNAP